MENSPNIPTKNDATEASFEAIIEKIYKGNGTKIEEIDNNELIITEKDYCLIEIDIVIEIPSHC